MRYEMANALLHEYDAGEPGSNVPVRLTAGALSQTALAKLDTGASSCIFRRGIGEALGLEIERGQPQTFSTANGSFLAYGHEITLATLGLEFNATVYFAHDENFRRDVLGRFGWLQQVKPGLVDYDGKLYVARYDDVA
jgi:hypothetical protein